MRFMVIVKANEDSEAGVMPSDDMLIRMGKFNEELVKAGVMLDGAGLHPSSKGVRIRYTGTTQTKVIDGPFPETKELVAGYWLLQTRTREECIEWVRRAPMGDGAEVEIRPLFELEDFDMGKEARELHDSLAQQVEKQKQG